MSPSSPRQKGPGPQTLSVGNFNYRLRVDVFPRASTLGTLGSSNRKVCFDSTCLSVCVYVCVCTCVHTTMCVQVRRQISGVSSSLLPPCGSQGSNSDPPPWWQRSSKLSHLSGPTGCFVSLRSLVLLTVFTMGKEACIRICLRVAEARDGLPLHLNDRTYMWQNPLLAYFFWLLNEHSLVLTNIVLSIGKGEMIKVWKKKLGESHFPWDSGY